MDGGAGVDRGRRSSALFLGGRPKLRGHYFFLVFGHSVGATPTPPLTMAIPTQPLVLALATAAALLHSHAGVVLASGPFSPGYEGQFCLSPIDVHPDVDSNHSSPVGRLCCGADPHDVSHVPGASTDVGGCGWSRCVNCADTPGGQFPLSPIRLDPTLHWSRCAGARGVGRRTVVSC